MGRTVRLTERDLTRLVRRVIREEDEDGESSSDCEGLIQTMTFIFKEYMYSIEFFGGMEEADEADAEGIYDQFETELAGILDHANQMDCDDEIINHLEIIYNEYLVDMANKLGLR